MNVSRRIAPGAGHLKSSLACLTQNPLCHVTAAGIPGAKHKNNGLIRCHKQYALGEPHSQHSDLRNSGRGLKRDDTAPRFAGGGQHWSSARQAVCLVARLKRRKPPSVDTETTGKCAINGASHSTSSSRSSPARPFSPN